MNKLLVIQTAALGYDFLGQDRWLERPVSRLEPVFPAVTCPVQATLRTGLEPAEHGMVMNGTWSAHLRRPAFWEQSSRLVEGQRIWETARSEGRTVGLLFWQQSLGEEVDFLLSPAPIHTHGGGMIQDVFSRPPELYTRIQTSVGRQFKLSSYWGPLASGKSSAWIADATLQTIQDSAPDLLLTYIPHLDYALQKFGPRSRQAAKALRTTQQILSRLTAHAQQAGYDWIVFGDYAIKPVTTPVYPNQQLHKTGMFITRRIGRRLYPDFNYSAAFAVVDHEIAHVYIQDPARIGECADCLNRMPGVARVLPRDKQGSAAHRNAGDLVLVAEEGAWFSYQWWDHPHQAPDYASHVDIHNKPGYDPCELFFGRHPFVVSTDSTRIKGSHGKTGQGREAALICSSEHEPIRSQVELAAYIQARINEQ